MRACVACDRQASKECGDLLPKASLVSWSSTGKYGLDRLDGLHCCHACRGKVIAHQCLCIQHMQPH
jgi:hypothetical protein